jgi:hypothetical protein
MKVQNVAATLVAAFNLCAAPLPGQQPSDTVARRQQRTLDSLTAALGALRARLDSVAAASQGAMATAMAQQAPAPARSGGAYMNVGFVALTDAGTSSASDVSPILQGDHDPKVRGFTIPNTELTLDGAVDPYFKGFSNIVFKIDGKGETGVELEEAYVLTTSLPANLQLKAGQFFIEFGRQNSQHPHAWSFLDQPVVMSRMFGSDGLRSQGLRLSWLAPTPWYSEAMVSVVNSTNGTTFSFRSDASPEIHGGVAIDRPVLGFRDMLVVPRFTTSFDLTETQTVVLGASGAFGPNNSGADAKTAIYGVDAYWKWKSPTAAAGFPFLSLQGEAMYRRYDAARRTSVDAPLVTLPSQTFADRGAYVQLLWGIKPRIVAGLRADVATGDSTVFVSAFRGDRLRISPNFTWYPTEFSKVRLQYNYDDRKNIATDHSLWVQFEFLLGAHAAHKF